MKKKITAAVVAAATIIGGGAAAGSVGTSSLHCYVNSWGAIDCTSYQDGTVRRQITAEDGYLLVEWDPAAAHCIVFEDLSGSCYMFDGGTIGYGGMANEYTNTIDVASDSPCIDMHVYLPNENDPNLQHPLIMFHSLCW